MIVFILIFITLAIIFGGIGFWGKYINDRSMWEGEVRMFLGFGLCILNLLVAGVALLLCLRWQMGTDIQTGYIYAVEEYFGKGTVHLRMSLEAGKDSQEPFCVDGDNLEKARALAGTGKKVRVTIPAAGFHFENDFFACTSKVIIEESEK